MLEKRPPNRVNGAFFAMALMRGPDFVRRRAELSVAGAWAGFLGKVRRGEAAGLRTEESENAARRHVENRWDGPEPQAVFFSREKGGRCAVLQRACSEERAVVPDPDVWGPMRLRGRWEKEFWPIFFAKLGKTRPGVLPHAHSLAMLLRRWCGAGGGGTAACRSAVGAHRLRPRAEFAPFLHWRSQSSSTALGPPAATTQSPPPPTHQLDGAATSLTTGGVAVHATSGDGGGKSSSGSGGGGFGTRIFDVVVDHPGKFFACLFGPLVAYVAYGVKDNSAREAAVVELEASAPISAREVAALGRANRLRPDAFRGMVDAAFSGMPSGRGSVAELLLLLRRARDGASGEAAVSARPGGLTNGHHLLRALGALAADATHGGGPVVDVAGGGGSDGVQPHATSSRAEACATALRSYEPTVDVLALLAMGGVVMGGRAEPFPGEEEEAADGGGGASAAPSQRLAVYLDMTRRYLALGGGGSEPAVPAVAGPGAAVYTQRELLTLIGVLADTWQLPARCRVHRVADYPLPVYALRSPTDHLHQAVLDAKLGGGVEGAAAAAVALAPPAHYSFPEVQRLFLRTKGICAWGECYATDGPPDPTAVPTVAGAASPPPYAAAMR